MNDWIDNVVRDISELPYRFPPDDMPDFLLVTPAELRTFIQRHLLAAELLVALSNAQRMLQSVAGDLEDGISPELRGKVCAAALRAADEASAALAKAKGEA